MNDEQELSLKILLNEDKSSVKRWVDCMQWAKQSKKIKLQLQYLQITIIMFTLFQFPSIRLANNTVWV